MPGKVNNRCKINLDSQARVLEAKKAGRALHPTHLKTPKNQMKTACYVENQLTITIRMLSHNAYFANPACIQQLMLSISVWGNDPAGGIDCRTTTRSLNVPLDKYGFMPS